MRLLGIVFGTLFFVFVIFWTIRFWGLGQEFAPYEHGFFKGYNPIRGIAVDTVEEAQSALAMDGGALIWLNLRTSADGIFYISSDNIENEALNPQILGDRFIGNKFYFYDSKFYDTRFPHLRKIEDFMTQLPNVKFILNVVDNVEKVHEQLKAKVLPFSPETRVLVQSDTEIVLKSIRHDNPSWVFGTSYSDIMRFLNFDSIGLLPACPFRGDVYVSPLQVFRRPATNSNIIAEMRRRFKKIILGPLSYGEIAAAKLLNPDIIIARDKEGFASLIH